MKKLILLSILINPLIHGMDVEYGGGAISTLRARLLKKKDQQRLFPQSQPLPIPVGMHQKANTYSSVKRCVTCTVVGIATVTSIAIGTLLISASNS